LRPPRAPPRAPGAGECTACRGFPPRGLLPGDPSAPTARAARGSKLDDRSDLDQEALAAPRLELDLGDRPRTVLDDVHHPAVTEVVVAHPVADRELQVPVVPQRADRRLPLGL